MNSLEKTWSRKKINLLPAFAYSERQEQTARLEHSYSDVEQVAHSFKSSAHSEFDFTTRMLLNEKKKQKTYTSKY